MLKADKGITLVALIITIIVLLILAGVSIAMVLGDNGLINKSRNAVNSYENAQAKENASLVEWEQELDRLINQVNGHGH